MLLKLYSVMFILHNNKWFFRCQATGPHIILNPHENMSGKLSHRSNDNTIRKESLQRAENDVTKEKC